MITRINYVKSASALLLLLSFFAIQSCVWNNEEELYPETEPCDTLNVSYSTDIAPVFQANCNACHSGNFASGGVSTDTYDDVKALVDANRLWGPINHEAGFSPMPKGMVKLGDCELKKIKSWMDNGSPNN
jgi:mono/diheme cytochrome c family protein